MLAALQLLRLNGSRTVRYSRSYASVSFTISSVCADQSVLILRSAVKGACAEVDTHRAFPGTTLFGLCVPRCRPYRRCGLANVETLNLGAGYCC